MDAAMVAQKEVVELGGQILDFDYVLRHMDPALYEEAMQWCGFNATPQAIVVEYVRIARARAERG